MTTFETYALSKAQRALADMKNLAVEVKEGLYLPKRFRAAPFTPELKEGYLTYLQKEISDLESRIDAATADPLKPSEPGAPVQPSVGRITPVRR